MEEGKLPVSNTYMTWTVLPCEIRRTILIELHRISQHVARYASVCREWQDSLEPLSLKALTVVPNDIPYFTETFRRFPKRQCYLHHLLYWIPLPKDAITLTSANDATFTSAVSGLFKALGDWEADSVLLNHGNGVSLEIGLDFPGQDGGDIRKQGLEQKHLVALFNTHIHFRCHGLGEVEVVTSFKILRRSLSGISEASRWELLACFPRLRELRAEMWQYADDCEQLGAEEDFYRHVRAWPIAPSLKGISIFRNSGTTFDGPIKKPQVRTASFDPTSNSEADEDMVTIGPQYGGIQWLVDDWDPVNDNHLDVPEMDNYTKNWRSILHASMATVLAKHSRSLEYFSVCNLIDARNFCASFLGSQACLKLPVWKNLRFLTLTSPMIVESQGDNDELNDLLCSMGAIAVNMPVIRVIELFNAQEIGAGLFQMVATDEKVALRWTSSWSSTLNPSTKQAWEGLTLYGRHTPKWLPDLQALDFASPRDFISRYLLTRAIALDTTTLVDITNAEALVDPLVALHLRGGRH